MVRKKSDIGLPKNMSPDTAYIQGVSDGLTEVLTEQEPEQVSFTTFHPINVPIPPLRRELAELAWSGVETMPLDALLTLIHRLVKESKNEPPV